MKTAFITFNQYRNYKETAGSYIRAYQLMPYLNAEEYKAGKKYDVVICQKAYHIPDAKIKILDLCDPEYLNLNNTHLYNKFDAITTSTEALKKDIEQYTDKPVVHIPDRYDLTKLPKPKKVKEIKKAVWFGYSENFDTIEQALPAIKKLGLKLTIISDTCYNAEGIKNKTFPGWGKEYFKRIQENDIAILPKLNHGKFKYKSDNKKVLAKLLGLYVAETQEELENPQPPEIKEDYDVKRSVAQLSKLIVDMCDHKAGYELPEEAKELIKQL